jgi:hypothetical protein
MAMSVNSCSRIALRTRSASASPRSTESNATNRASRTPERCASVPTSTSPRSAACSWWSAREAPQGILNGVPDGTVWTVLRGVGGCGRRLPGSPKPTGLCSCRASLAHAMTDGTGVEVTIPARRPCCEFALAIAKSWSNVVTTGLRHDSHDYRFRVKGAALLRYRNAGSGRHVRLPEHVAEAGAVAEVPQLRAERGPVRAVL